MTRTLDISPGRRITWRPLTPEEDAILDGDETEFDDLLPADLWFRSQSRRGRVHRAPGSANNRHRLRRLTA